jgi:hypothetical protein
MKSANAIVDKLEAYPTVTSEVDKLEAYPTVTDEVVADKVATPADVIRRRMEGFRH